MHKRYEDMTTPELAREVGIWGRVRTMPDGRHSPRHDARAVAARHEAEAEAWLCRRWLEQEDTP